jgi:DNA-directed RNA polymerase specialized sigma24 family protein
MEFEALIEKVSFPLEKMARYLNGCSRFIDEEDLVQEAFSHLWIRYRQGELEDKTNSYILQSCYFYLKNYLRKAREKAKVVSLYTPIDEEGATLADVIPQDSPSLTETLDTKMHIGQIRKMG